MKHIFLKVLLIVLFQWDVLADKKLIKDVQFYHSGNSQDYQIEEIGKQKDYNQLENNQETQFIDNNSKKSMFLDATLDKLRSISEWIDRMLGSRQGQSKIFERLTRSRLDRMPLTYGKRGLMNNELTYGKRGLMNNELTYGKRGLMNDEQDQSLFIINFRDRLMPLSFVSDGFLADKTEGQGDEQLPAITELNDGDLMLDESTAFDDSTDFFTHSSKQPQKRNRLSRMPLNFGKRRWVESTSYPPYNRNHRSRLDRMPIHYGKRSLEQFFSHCIEVGTSIIDTLGTESQGEGRKSLFVRCIPRIAYEQREAESISNEIYNEDDDSKDKQLIFPKEKTSGQQTVMFRVKRSKLSRMPFAYGKRENILTNWQPNEKLLLTANSFNHSTDSSKRWKFMDIMSLEKQLTNSMGSLMKRHRLDRMPLSYGKRLNVSSGNVVLATSAGSRKMELNQLLRLGQSQIIYVGQQGDVTKGAANDTAGSSIGKVTKGVTEGATFDRIRLSTSPQLKEDTPLTDNKINS